MTIITIQDSNNNLDYLYTNGEWKNYVCEDFDNKVVLLGNRDYKEEAYADWWRTAKDIANDLDQLDENEFIESYRDTYPEETIIKMIQAYKRTDYSDKPEFLMEIAMLSKPGLELELRTIRGYTQSEWREVVYIKDSLNIKVLETYHFGQLTEIGIDQDGETSYDTITDDDLYEMLNNGDVYQNFRARYDIPSDEEVVIKKFSGYSQVANYEEL
jgi:hypothetical protein